jgi:hypothetical protein
MIKRYRQIETIFRKGMSLTYNSGQLILLSGILAGLLRPGVPTAINNSCGFVTIVINIALFIVSLLPDLI